MMSALVLSLWVSIGLLSSWRYHDKHSKPMQWWPLAIVLGPFWAPVTYELRQTEVPVP